MLRINYRISIIFLKTNIGRYLFRASKFDSQSKTCFPFFSEKSTFNWMSVITFLSVRISGNFPQKKQSNKIRRSVIGC